MLINSYLFKLTLYGQTMSCYVSFKLHTPAFGSAAEEVDCIKSKACPSKIKYLWGSQKWMLRKWYKF